MKINSSDLAKIIGRMRSVIKKAEDLSRPFAYVLFKMKAGHLQIRAEDEACQLTFWTQEVEGDDEELVIPGAALCAAVSALPKDREVSLSAGKKGIVTMSTGATRFKFTPLVGVDFLPSETGDGQQKDGDVPVFILRLPEGEFVDILKTIGLEMPISDVRAYLNGMAFVQEKTGVNIVATNGQYLAIHSATTEESAEITRIVPCGTIHRLIKVLDASGGEEVEINIGRQAEFSFSGGKMVSNLIDAKFPDYKQVIPQLSENYVTVNRGILRDALSRVSAVSAGKYQGISVRVKANEILIQSKTDAAQSSENVEIIAHKGEDFEFNVASSYICGAMNSVEGENVRIYYKDGSPVLVQGETNKSPLTVVIALLRD